MSQKSRGLERTGGGEGCRLAAGKVLGGAGELGPQGAVRVDDCRGEREGGAIRRLIADLGLNVDGRGLVLHVVVGTVDVNAARFQIFVERERLVDLAHEMQGNVAVEPAEIGIAVAELPFEGRARRLFFVFDGVVDFHGQHVVLAAKFHLCGDVQPAGSDAILEESDGLAVEVEPRRLLKPLEFEEDLLALGAGGQFEMLAIPADALVVGSIAAAVADQAR